MLSTYLKCPRQYNYRFVQHFSPKIPPSAPAFGAAIHSALYTYDISKKGSSAIETFKAEWTNPQGDPVRTVEKGISLLEDYFKFYTNDYLEVLQSEIGFSIPLTSEDLFFGRIDVIASYGLGRFCVCDRKTGKYLPKAEEFLLDLQLRGYTYAAKEITSLPLTFAMIDFIQVTKTKKSPDIFARPLIFYPQYRLDEWREEVIHWLEIIKKDKVFAPNRTACHYYGKCQFFDVCILSAPQRIKLLEKDFIIKEWLPY